MRLVFASNNANKLREVRDILAHLDVEILSQREAGLELDVEETGTTFEENALLKARAASEASGLPAFADDSGLCVNALGGAPGVYSARYGNLAGDAERCEYLLENMRGASDRAAAFVSAIACVFPSGDVIRARGECRGELISEPRGRGGFGYDPIFVPEGREGTFSELSMAEKNSISHRGLALRDFTAKLEDYLKTH